MLKVKVAKRRDGFDLDAQFEAPTPGVVALFGRSGCGKTTAINILSGLLVADSAYIELDGQVLTDTAAGTSIPPEQRRIGYVFQDGRSFPHMSVLRNLQYGLKRSPALRLTITFDQIVALLGLERLLQRQPYQLSGGERQRAAIAGALAAAPSALVLD